MILPYTSSDVGSVVKRRSPAALLWHDASLPAALVADLWTAPDRLIAGGALLKDGPRSDVVRLDVGERTFVFKRNNLGSTLHTAVHWFKRSRARWCWRNAHLLLRAGLLSPRPLAMLEERQLCVFGRRSYLLTEFIEGVCLRDWIARGEHDPAQLQTLLAHFAHAWRTLKRLRVGHGDMKAANFMVDAQMQLWFIDLDGMRLYPPGPILRARRRKDLAWLLRNWKHYPEVAAALQAQLVG